MTFSEQFSTILVKIADLFKTKADKTALSSYALKSNTYTKQETTNAINTALEGIDVSSINATGIKPWSTDPVQYFNQVYSGASASVLNADDGLATVGISRISGI